MVLSFCMIKLKVMQKHMHISERCISSCALTVSCGTFVLIFSIYLFIYSKRCQQKQLQETTFVYLWNELFLHMLFLLIFMIYLFIYSKRCKQRQVEVTTFIYLCKSLVVRNAFRFNIHDLFIYLLKAMSTKAGGAHLFLFTYANSLLLRLNRFFLWFNYIKLESKLLRFFLNIHFRNILNFVRN